MNTSKVLGLIVLIAGALSLIYGGFKYTKAVHETTVGPVVIAVKEEQRVNIPLWAGVAALVIGSGLFLIGNKKS